MSKANLVSSFDHPHRDSHEELRTRLGGKGFSLWLMRHELKLPVPPGFTVGTSACQDYLRDGPNDALTAAIREAVDGVEAELGERFGDPLKPLLVSVRSGAAASMPGMMDTVLNVGMTPAIAEALAATTGNQLFALQSYYRFLVSFAETVH